MRQFPPADLGVPEEMLKATGNVERAPIVQIVDGSYIYVTDVQEDLGTATGVVVHSVEGSMGCGHVGYVVLGAITDPCVTRH